MITVSKTEMKSDPTLNKVLDMIIKNHIPAPHTIKVLMENSHIKDFCETAEHYAELKIKTSIYISYRATSWIKENRILVQIESVTFFDEWNQYQAHRLKGLHSGAPNHNVENN
jgi:hypothetical protein